MDDLDFSVWKDADDGHLPLVHDLELSVLLVVLGEQMLPGTADVDGAGVVHTVFLLRVFELFLGSISAYHRATTPVQKGRKRT